MSKPGCPRCGCKRFFAHQSITADIIVDENNDFVENCLHDDIVSESAGSPFGPYICCDCREQYDEIPGLDKVYCLGCDQEIMTESGHLCKRCKEACNAAKDIRIA